MPAGGTPGAQLRKLFDPFASITLRMPKIQTPLRVRARWSVAGCRACSPIYLIDTVELWALHAWEWLGFFPFELRTVLFDMIPERGARAAVKCAAV